MRPPYNRSHAEVGSLTDAQVFGFFAADVDGEGRPKPPPLLPQKSARDYFAERCFLAGVWEPAEVARLWPAEWDRLEALAR
jgi:hypothetical protein